MMNKKGYLTRDFIIAGIFLMGVIALMVLMVQDLAINYDREDLVDEDFKEKYDKLEDVTEPVKTLLAEVSSPEGLSFKGVFDVAFGAAFVGITLIFGIISLFGSVFINVIADFAFNSKIGTIAFTIGLSAITVTLIFVWLSSISRGRI